MDDEHANVLFKLLEDEKYKDNSFLIYALSKFKKTENKKNAIVFAINELKQPNHSNEVIANLIYVLQKFKALEAKSVIASFVNFPKNYKRGKASIDKEKFQFVEDKHIRKVAQKALAS